MSTRGRDQQVLSVLINDECRVSMVSLEIAALGFQDASKTLRE